MMKKTLLGVLTFCATVPLWADDIKSNVIHDYSLIQLNYNYLHDLGNTGLNAHGAGASVAYEFNNFLFATEGGYAWGG